MTNNFFDFYSQYKHLGVEIHHCSLDNHTLESSDDEGWTIRIYDFYGTTPENRLSSKIQVSDMELHIALEKAHASLAEYLGEFEHLYRN
jgi:hypothetical protein